MKKILVMALMFAMIASNCFAALNDYSYANQNKKSQRQVMHDFMQTLDKSSAKIWLNALDEATNKASEGKFQTLAIALNSFINDYNKSIKYSNGNITDDSAKEFLLKYCGIDLSNEDVGAIIGKDAGESLMELTAESIIPENVDNIIYLDKLWNESPISLSKINKLDDVFAVRLPMSTLNFDKRGLNFVVANYEILDKKDKNIVNGLYNWWIEGALDLIEKSYGLKFSNDELHQLLYIDSFKIYTSILGAAFGENTLAAAGKNGNNLVLYVNKKYFDDDFEIRLNPSGRFEHQFLDRTIAHELTHAIMAAKIPAYSPNDYLFVTEGLAELTVGADDTRDLIGLLKNPERLANAFKNPNKSEYGYYGAGYMFFRYFAKQVADSQNVKTNKPMIFSQPVKIGEVILPPMGFFEVEGHSYHKGTPCKKKEYEHLNLYEKGIARFGEGSDALYFHYDVNQKVKIPDSNYYGAMSRFGSRDVKNAVQVWPGIPTIIWKIKTNSDMVFYMLEHGDASGLVGTTRTLIGRKKDGTFVKYFYTYEISKKYFGEKKTHKDIKQEQSSKIFFEGNTIIVPYYVLTNVGGTYQNIPKGEFRFKWDDVAQWFSVDHIVY